MMYRFLTFLHKRIFLWTGLAILVMSCFNKDDFNFDDLNAVEVSPALAIPLVHGDVNLKHFLDRLDMDEVEVRVKSDCTIYLYFKEEMPNRELGDLLRLPATSVPGTVEIPAGSGLTAGVLPQNVTIPPGGTVRRTLIFDIADADLDFVILNELSIFYNLEPNFASKYSGDIRIEISMPTLVSNTTGLPFHHQELIRNDAGGSFVNTRGNVSLQDYTMTLNTLDPPYNRMPVDIIATFMQGSEVLSDLDVGDAISFEVRLWNQSFKESWAYVHRTPIDIERGEIDLGALEDVFGDAEFTLNDTKLTMTIDNEYGVPYAVDFKEFYYVYEGGTNNIDLSVPNPVAIAKASAPGQTTTTTFSITNIDQLINDLPTKIIYDVAAIANHLGDNEKHFVTDTAVIKVTIEGEIPLYGSIPGTWIPGQEPTGLVLRDTLSDLGLEDFEGSDVTVTGGYFNAKIENGFPLEALVSIYGTNENYTEYWVLFDDQVVGVPSGVPDQNLKVTPSVLNKKIQLNRESLEKLFDMKHIIIVSLLRTYNDGQGSPDVKIMSDQNIDISLGLYIDSDVKINFEN